MPRAPSTSPCNPMSRSSWWLRSRGHAHRWRIRAAACGWVAVIAACTTVGPDHRHAPVEAPTRWQDQHAGDPQLAAPPGAADAGPDNRWAVFADPELVRLLALVREASPDVRTAALRVLQSRMEERIVSAQAGPQSDARSAVNRERQSEYGSAARVVSGIGGPEQNALLRGLSAPFTLYQAGFDASWELDLWGRVLRSAEAAKATADGQAAALRQAQLGVAAELARDYFALRSAQRQRLLAADGLAAAQEFRDFLEAQREAGLIDESAPIAQRSVVAGLQATLPALAAQEAQALNQITLLCGARPGEFNERLSTFHAETPEPALPDLHLGVPGALARHRPDIVAAEERLHAATANIGVAVADLYPRITLGATFGPESVGSQRLGDWGSRQWSVGPSLSVPLFDQGRRRAEITLRELEQQEAAVAFQQTVLKAWHEVDDAVSAYVSERQRHAEFMRRLHDADQQWTLARARYDSGLTTYQPVLGATSTRIDAMRDRVQSTARVQTALTAVYKALGDDADRSIAPP